MIFHFVDDIHHNLIVGLEFGRFGDHFGQIWNNGVTDEYKQLNRI